jgi:hypothetical protein
LPLRLPLLLRLPLPLPLRLRLIPTVNFGRRSPILHHNRYPEAAPLGFHRLNGDRLRLPPLVFLIALSLHADPIPVKQVQGAVQGFLVVRDVHGRPVGTGNFQQTSRGALVTSRIVYTFNDGSVDEETTVFTQNRVFHVISDHHIQRGPFFAKPVDVAFETATRNVTTRNPDKSTTKEIEKDIPTDVANGITGIVLQNVSPKVSPFELPMIAPDPKARLIKMKISPEAEGAFTVAGVAHKATIFDIHLDLGGVAGVIAPMIGKQPSDVRVWIAPGNAPVFVREVTQLSEGGPVVSIELAGTHFEPVEPTTGK